MNFTEKDIQEYLWSNKDRWGDLILPIDTPGTDLTPDPLQVTAGKVLCSLTFRRLERLYELVQSIEIFGVEVPLEKEDDSTIRADFIGNSVGSPGIAIIELKRSKQTEREAFTELLAYSNHINSIFPTHCTDDNILVLIAPMEVRTVREAYLQTLLFDQKNVFALTLVFEDHSRLESLKLAPFVPSQEDIITLSEVAFAKRNFDVHVQVWEDTPGFWNPTKEERGPDKYQRENMNRVSMHAAQLMEARKVHGFVYTQQSWPELEFPYPNSLVIAGFNPYRIANDQFYKNEIEGIKISEIPTGSDTGPNLADFIAGLNKHSKSLHEEHNYVVDLDTVWMSHLHRIARSVVDLVNLNTNKGEVHDDSGSMNWEEYESNFLENVACTNFDIRPTGILRELFWETLKIDYEYWNLHGEHPIQGDIYQWAIEVLSSHHFFSEFLSRMFGDPFEIRGFEEAEE